MLTNSESPLKKHCPDTFEIDISGKRKEWEGIVILPMVEFELVKSTYMQYINQENAQKEVLLFIMTGLGVLFVMDIACRASIRL